MNREILFRGKPMFRESNEFVYGYYKHGNIAGVETDFILPLPEYKNEINEVAVCPSTVGQYTGLTDRNGVKIFEGDIVVWDYNAPDIDGTTHTTPEPVEWNDKFCGFANDDGVRYDNECRIIGNVHDTPELLKGEENA